VQPDPIIDLQVEAYIDGDYVSDAMHKIEIYQRIAGIRSNAEIQNLLDELIDRFGEPTPAVMNLLEVAKIKNYARELKIRTISELPKALDLYILPGHRLPAKGLLAVDKVLGRSMRSLPGKNGYRFVIHESQKKQITNFVLRLLLLASGNAEAAQQKAEPTSKKITARK
jgi:transcription-repair coupling factor (superfamily II helicase)